MTTRVNPVCPPYPPDVAERLDLMMLAGWYHAISFTANGARVACEDGVPRFADVVSTP